MYRVRRAALENVITTPRVGAVPARLVRAFFRVSRWMSGLLDLPSQWRAARRSPSRAGRSAANREWSRDRRTKTSAEVAGEALAPTRGFRCPSGMPSASNAPGESYETVCVHPDFSRGSHFSFSVLARPCLSPLTNVAEPNARSRALLGSNSYWLSGSSEPSRADPRMHKQSRQWL